MTAGTPVRPTERSDRLLPIVEVEQHRAAVVRHLQ
jgi:hypothetical protein